MTKNDYYYKIDEKLAKRVISDVIKTIGDLAENPIHHQLKYKDMRIAFAPSFPYGVHFFADKNQNLHSKSFPYEEIFQIKMQFSVGSLFRFTNTCTFLFLQRISNP